MLVDLHVENFALLDRLDLNFGPGLIVLTGETGAGKSIVVDAINMLLGERASADAVRTGAEKAVVQGVFDTSGVTEVDAQLASLGFDIDDLLYISREVTTQGRSQCRVNGRIAQVSALRDITQTLADVHGQHEHQLLLSPNWQMSFLDSFAGPACTDLRDRFTRVYRDLEAARTALGLLDTDQREKARLQDLYRFQIAEIEKAALRLGEKEELQAEALKLANVGKLFEAAHAAHELLHGSDSATGAVQMAQQALRTLEAVSAFDAAASGILEQLSEGAIALEEAAGAIRQWRDTLDASPERLDEVQARLETIDSLTRKYGETVEDVLAYKEETAAALHELEYSDERKQALLAEVQTLEKQASELAVLLSEARRQAAAPLGGRAQEEMRDLGMPDAHVVVEVVDTGMSASGADQVSFLFSANAGEPPRQLSKVASGGELSRAMLALKTVLTRDDPVRCLVFDEIDAGIGGRIATRVGEKLKKLADGRQVLCVTHLAQIARFADTHILVSKHTAENRTYINARALEPPERVEELARMLGGDMESEAAVRHARELLSAG